MNTADKTYEISLTEEQKKEGYRVEVHDNRVLVWHRQNQIALLLASPDIESRVRDLIERRRSRLKEIEARTGYRLDQ